MTNIKRKASRIKKIRKDNYRVPKEILNGKWKKIPVGYTGALLCKAIKEHISTGEIFYLHGIMSKTSLMEGEEDGGPIHPLRPRRCCWLYQKFFLGFILLNSWCVRDFCEYNCIYHKDYVEEPDGHGDLTPTVIRWCECPLTESE